MDTDTHLNKCAHSLYCESVFQQLITMAPMTFKNASTVSKMTVYPVAVAVRVVELPHFVVTEDRSKKLHDIKESIERTNNE